jgi:shikimate kinase
MEKEENLNIILIGMMGTGKSFIGAKLAKLLAHFNYVDTDEIIEKKEGISISEIFEKYGEKRFRELEAMVIKEISQCRNQIISIGGGAFENPENIDVLKKNGLTFYLKTPPKEIFRRIEKETHRPILGNDFSLKTIENLLRKRDKNYFKADFIVDTYERPAYTIMDDILKEYENYVNQNPFSRNSSK